MCKVRRFGQWKVCINRKGHVFVVGDWLSNHGTLYPHMFERLQRGQDVQFVGMDSMVGMTKRVTAYIKKVVVSGDYDYLVDALNGIY